MDRPLRLALRRSLSKSNSLNEAFRLSQYFNFLFKEPALQEDEYEVVWSFIFIF